MNLRFLQGFSLSFLYNYFEKGRVFSEDDRFFANFFFRKILQFFKHKFLNRTLTACILCSRKFVIDLALAMSVTELRR
jgi:hypothetical protein